MMRVRTLILLSMLLLLTVAATQARWQPQPEQGHKLLSRLQLNADVLAVRGDYLYAGDHDRFVVVDITDLKNPTEVGELPLNAIIWDIAITPTVAFVGVQNPNGVVVIDISNPNVPTLLNTYPTGDGVPIRLFVQQSYLYLIAADTLYILDISSPSSLAEVGSLQYPYLTDDLEVQGLYAYVSGGPLGRHYVSIVSIENPVQPVELTYWESNKWEGSVQGSVFFSTTSSCSSFCVTDLATWDISDIYNPVRLDFAGVSSQYATALEVSEIYAYLGTDEGLYYFDTSDPTDISDGTMIESGQLSDIVVQGDTLFAAVSGDIEIYAVPPIKRTFLPLVFR